jgi:hypothetical protein
MTVDQFIPEAKPVTAKSGSLVVEVEPLLRLGGEPVARIEDKRFAPLVELLIELDIGVILFPQFSNFRPSNHLRQKLGRRTRAAREHYRANLRQSTYAFSISFSAF